jgi:hypothetical protein
MAGDWIKMRASLLTNPRVTALCKLIENSKLVGKKLSAGYGGALREIVTRDVTRDVTVASLFRVWCAANEHTTDGVWYGIELDDLDHVAGIPGFGDMMEAVGWAVVDVDSQTVTFPNFLEYNAPAKDGRVSSSAERQRRYREKNRTSVTVSDVTRDVTRDVTETVTSNVEKRREEKSIKKEITRGEEFQNCWSKWKRHLGQIQKPLSQITEETQLMQLGRIYPNDEDAIQAIEYSISVQAKNLILNGDHKPKTRKFEHPNNKTAKSNHDLLSKLR